jgi:lysophospholipase L1-like esterase
MKVENIILPIFNIRDESEGDVDDAHFSEKTQRELAEKLLTVLDKGGSISKKLL